MVKEQISEPIDPSERERSEAKVGDPESVSVGIRRFAHSFLGAELGLPLLPVVVFFFLFLAFASLSSSPVKQLTKASIHVIFFAAAKPLGFPSPTKKHADTKRE